MSPKSYSRQYRHRGCIIRQRKASFQVESNHAGRRRRVSFKTQKEAEAYADQIADQIKEDGAQAISLSGDTRRDAVEALKVLPDHKTREDAREALRLLSKGHDADLDTPRNTPLAEAMRFWLRHHPEDQQAADIEQVFQEYVLSKKHCRPATIREIKNKVRRFVDAFEGYTVADITQTDVRDWLQANTDTPVTFMKYFWLTHAFFAFAVRRGYRDKIPLHSKELDSVEVDETTPECYSVRECRALLKAASTTAPEIVPMLALGLFAGLRPNEVRLLDWSDVDFDEALIRVRPEVAKKRRRRFVTMSPNLAQWLLPYRQDKGPVAVPDITYRRKREKVLKATGIDRWIRDGLRHTFASYHIAMHRDPGSTALELGHSGDPSLVFNHYRELVKKNDAKEFWKIEPNDDGKLLAFSRSA